MKQCPQCRAPFKEMTDTGPKYECNSVMHIIGSKPGTLTSTGTCATNGREVFEEWADSQLKKKKL